jgi:NAD(P)-dependent dehydrogenase (short-subunit alcohol dehydrogenase family)
MGRKRDLSGAVVVVTGASSGVGHAAVTAFARRGATVIAVARRADPLDRLVERANGRVIHKDHFQEQPADPTSGNLHAPMALGEGPRGGWKGGATPSARRVAIGSAAALLAAVLLGSGRAR